MAKVCELGGPELPALVVAVAAAAALLGVLAPAVSPVQAQEAVVEPARVPSLAPGPSAWPVLEVGVVGFARPEAEAPIALAVLAVPVAGLARPGVVRRTLAVSPVFPILGDVSLALELPPSADHPRASRPHDGRQTGAAAGRN